MEVLLEHGWTAAEVAALQASGVVHCNAGKEEED